MSLNVRALRESFDLVIDRCPELTARFYEIFFQRYPQVRAMFGRNAPRVQQEMLARALAAVLEHLEDAPWLARTLGGLGAKHVEYGVRPEMYDWVGECLLATLAEVAGAEWTPELERAWTDAYGAIRDLMLAGAAEAPVAQRVA
jgi:hemoglobin-like flavoprotein